MHHNKALLLIAALLGIFTMACNRSDEYHVRFSHAHGLHKGAAVEVNGYRIGTVHTLALQNDQSVVATLRITEELHIASNSHFVCQPTSLLGDKVVALVPGSAESPLSQTDTLVGIVAPFKNALQSAVDCLTKPAPAPPPDSTTIVY